MVPEIRSELASDRDSIRVVNQAAFGGSEESTLVDRLRHDGRTLVSLVAELDGSVVGHILFSRMWIRTAERTIDVVALAPVAVFPEYQRRGIGSELILRGLECLFQLGEAIVLVLGHPNYYPRFGFSTEKARFLQSPFPPEAFMALELKPDALAGIHGAVVYPDAFGLSDLR